MELGRSWRILATHGLLALGSAVAVAVGTRLAMVVDCVAPNWILDGLLLAVLLQTPRPRMPARLLSAFIGAATVWALAGVSLVTGLVLGGGTLLFLAVAIAALDRIGWKPADMATSRGLWRGALVILGVAPLLPAVLVALASRVLAFDDFVGVLWHWLLTEALGLAIVTPLVLTLARRDAMLLAVPPLLSSTLVLVAVYAAIAGAAFLQSEVPLGLLIFPPLLLLVGRLGFPGAGLGILVTAVIAALGAILGRGRFGIAPGATAYGTLTFMQFMLAVASVMVYPLAAAVSERRRMNQALSDQHSRLSRSEYRYRLLADNASDIITRVRLDGRRLYVSPSVKDVLGWTPDEMTRSDRLHDVHPEDLPGYLAAQEEMRLGAESVGNTYRHRRRDGTWCWIEARLHLIRKEDGQAKEFVANLRDITGQKEIELALEAARAELAETAATDGLTGVANRRRFDEALDHEWRRSLRAAGPIAVLMIDADHFKSYNDRYGHQAGDECLRAIARTIAASIRRPHDLVARYGGEEFVVILPVTDEAGARGVGERIRDAIQALDLPHEANTDGVVTVSIGVAAVTPEPQVTAGSLIQAADAALYRAKRAGRNRIEVASTHGSTTVVPLRLHIRRGLVNAVTIASLHP